MMQNESKKKPKALASWKRCLILIPIAMLVLGASGCPPKLKWQGKPYVTDAHTASIVRQVGKDEQGNPIIDQILCEDPAFNGRVCYTTREILDLKRELEEMRNRCKRWE